jgi:hypothetical protein
MRIALRVLFFEFALSWAMVLAGSVRVAMGAWPFVGHSLARLRSRAWRVGLGVMVAIPVVAGWPALFEPSQAQYVGGDWLNIAIPWWILIGVLGAEILAVRLNARSRAGSAS